MTGTDGGGAVIHPDGGFRYLPAIDPYSSGVAAEPGFAILGLVLPDLPPVAAAFEALDAEIARRGLSPASLVGCHLRSPRQFSFDGFGEFNAHYHALLTDRGLLVDGANPLARTNVVPEIDAPTEPVMLAAFLAVPDERGGGTDFVVAGAGELDGDLGQDSIVAAGDHTASGLRAKSATVIGEMRGRLTALGGSADAVTVSNVYTVHEVPDLTATLSGELPGTARWGHTRWRCRPPVLGLEFEMDCSRVSGWATV